MLKKTLAALAATTALAVPLATASAASAGTPVYKHVVSVSTHSYIYWDRNWPYPNRAASSNQGASSTYYSGGGSSRIFYTTAAPPGDSYLEGVHEEAYIATHEIANSGGAVTTRFDNWLSYGSCGAANGCWSNHQVANFKINANGTAYYELLNDNGDGSWGETDIVVHNYVYQ